MTRKQFIEAAKYAVSNLEPEQVKYGWYIIGKTHLYELPEEIESDLFDSMDEWCIDNDIDSEEWQEKWDIIDVWREGQKGSNKKLKESYSKRKYPYSTLNEGAIAPMTYEQFIEAAKYAVSNLEPEQVEYGWYIIGKTHLYKLPEEIKSALYDNMDEWCIDNDIDPDTWQEEWDIIDVWCEGQKDDDELSESCSKRKHSHRRQHRICIK